MDFHSAIVAALVAWKVGTTPADVMIRVWQEPKFAERLQKALIEQVQFEDIVRATAIREGIPDEVLVRVVQWESTMRPYPPLGGVGEIGPCQVHPRYAIWFLLMFGRDILKDRGLGETLSQVTINLTQEVAEEVLADPQHNMTVMARNLKWMYSRYESWRKTIVGYNWGGGNVANAGDQWWEKAPAATRRYATYVSAGLDG